MKALPAPPGLKHDARGDDPDATAPGVERGLASPSNPRALAMLDDEVTVARDRDVTTVRRDPPRAAPLAPDPATLPLGVRTRDLFSGEGATSLRVETPADDETLSLRKPAAHPTLASLDESVTDAAPRDPLPIHRMPVPVASHDTPELRPRPPTLAPSSPAGLFPLPPPRPPTASVASPAHALPPPPALATPPVLVTQAPAAERSAHDLFEDAPDDLFGMAPTALPPPRAVPAPPSPAPEEDSAERSQIAPSPEPSGSLRSFIAWRKANPGRGPVEERCVAFVECLVALHARGVVLGERLLPENFTCHDDNRVEYLESVEVPGRTLVEQYLAPELLRARSAVVQSDVFGAAAVVYEMLVGRALKPAFLPQVVQTIRTDTWFSDPGGALADPYRVLLRRALSDRVTERHADMATFAAEFVRAWRLVHNPIARPAPKEEPKPIFTRGVKVGIVVGVFFLIVLVIALFPVERIDQPAVPTEQPTLDP